MVKIKICGLFTENDIAYVNEALPDYIGFVFAESRRKINETQAGRLKAILDKRIIPIGVFANSMPEKIRDIYRSGTISIAQLHGNESSEYINYLKKICGIPVIKSINASKGIDTAELERSPADYILLDNGAGGTGNNFDWSNIPAFNKPYFLAGGINTGNMTAALTKGAYCIDVSSGAETNGFKDRQKITELVERTRRNL